MADTQLLPCPFCGGTDLSIETNSVQPDEFHDAWVNCGECNADGRHAMTLEGWLPTKAEAKEEAVVAWNRRAATPSPSIAPEVGIAVSNNDLGVHIVVSQRHADGSVTVIYSAKAPVGDSFGRAALASRPAEVDDEGLPPLPKEVGYLYGISGDVHFSSSLQVAKFDRESYEASVSDDPDMQHEEPEPLFTAEQYRQGQRNAVAADRARRGTIDRPRITEIVSDCMSKHGVQYQPGMGAMIVDLMEEFGAAPSHTTNKENG